MPEPDPFHTASLRAGVLAAWADSPTRFREDANAEEDLLLGGYADRWLVELAQNAADAAQRAARPGRLLVRMVAGPAGDELWVANTGMPLDADGVAALASLRASTKRDTDAVGRFGVGFAAVLEVSDEPRLVSTTGGVRFAAADTRAEVAALTGAAAAELARRAGRPPVLRLPWPVAGSEPGPPPEYDTEVRLPLRPRPGAGAGTGPDLGDGATAQDADADHDAADGFGIEAGRLTATADDSAADLLLALPWLAEITVLHPDGRRTEHRRTDHPDGTVVLVPGGDRWLLVRRAGLLTGDDAARAVEERAGWAVCWALRLSPEGRPVPLTRDVLHAPTPSDERLTLPARLIAALPMQPTRRRVRTGAGVDEVVRQAAATYLDLVLVLSPEHRALLAPSPGFPLGELDEALRAEVSAVLAAAPWLPAARAVSSAGVSEGSSDEPPPLVPGQARLLDPPGSPELAGLVVDAVPELLADTVRAAPRAALTALGVRPLGLAELADRLAGLAGSRRAPTRWRAVYAALAAGIDAVPDARQELAALPVPLVDGRTVTGPRAALVLDGEPSWTAAVSRELAALKLPGVRVVHPDAVHPLLSTLGATVAGPAGVLDHPGLVEAVRRSENAAHETAAAADTPADTAAAGDDETRGLARLVLGLLAELASASGPLDTAARPWLGALALPDVNGAQRRADELMLPDAVIRPLLAPDAPLGVLDPGLAEGFPRDMLTSVGVLDSFAVLLDEAPTGPDHDLADERRWWDELDEPPAMVLAVRDLDLVDDDAWPAALALLAADPAARRALHAPHSYTSWWLARHARLAGRHPGCWRLSSATELAGLFEPVPAELMAGQIAGLSPDVLSPDVLAPDVLAAVGVRRDLYVRDRADAEELLTRLADPDRTPDTALTWRVHAELAAAVVAGRVDPRDLDPPARLRSMAGSVVGADRAVLLDRPWLAPALPPHESVPGVFHDAEHTDALAELLDLPLASELVLGTVVRGAGAEPAGAGGRPTRWSELAEVVSACAVLGTAVPDGELWLHDVLTVGLTRPAPARLRVPVWHDVDGRWHASDPVRALLARIGA